MKIAIEIDLPKRDIKKLARQGKIVSIDIKKLARQGKIVSIDNIPRGNLCPDCLQYMGFDHHGVCEKCKKYCGCSFNPTSSNDYCQFHR